MSNNPVSLPDTNEIVGYVDPLIGRIAKHDVAGYFGFPLIRAGQTVTHGILDKAQSLGRLFELTAATDDV